MERNVEIDKISDGKRYGANDLVKVGCDDCRGCSACCHGMGDSIVLDPMDVYRLEKKLGKTMEEILLAGNVALRVVDGVILPHLKMTEQSDRCSFLNEEGRCSIHDARPGFCRMFPLGRLYEDGTFSYFLQVNECPKENKTKVKVRRWLDTPELGKYEAFTTKWHYYLKEKQNAARESEDDAFRQQKMICPFFSRTSPVTCTRETWAKLISRPFPPWKKRSLGVRQTVRSANVQRVVKSP